jgi:hypothetical protein
VSDSEPPNQGRGFDDEERITDLSHTVTTVIDGWDKFWARCWDCGFRDGPFDDEIDADHSVLWHEWITTPSEPPEM